MRQNPILSRVYLPIVKKLHWQLRVYGSDNPYYMKFDMRQEIVIITGHSGKSTTFTFAETGFEKVEKTDFMNLEFTGAHFIFSILKQDHLTNKIEPILSITFNKSDVCD